MKNYTEYEVEDFVQDIYFRKWVLGKLKTDDQFWPQWQVAHTWQKEKIEQAKVLVLAFQFDDFPGTWSEDEIAIRKILSESEENHNIPLYRRTWFRAAASIILIAGIFAWKTDFLSSGKTAFNPIGSHVAQNKIELNNSSKPKKLRLVDGTVITLLPQSSIRVGEEFGEAKREVYLIGEAAFDVAKDAQRPFLVYTGKLVTKVLGTSFEIKAYEQDANVSVAVKSGKVTVYKNDKSEQLTFSEEIILMPNQQAVYLKADEKLVKTLVKNPVEIAHAVSDQHLEFNEIPIPQVLSVLENSYGVKIIFDNDLFKKCNLTAILTHEPLFEKLDMICETIQANYEIIDGQIVITGKGCH